VFGTYATTFNTKVTNAVTYTTVAGNADATFAAVSSTVAAVAGTTFTLTTSSNTFTGNTGDDNFDGSFTSTGAQTLNTGDRLDGGAGTDTLTADIKASVTPSSLANIEIVNLITSADSSVNLSNAAAVTNVNSIGATGDLTLEGIGAGVVVGIQDTTNNITLTFNAVTGSTDSATITLQNVTVGILDVADIETLNIASNGSANTITTLAADATKLVVTGSKALTITNNAATVATIDASAATGAVTAAVAPGAATVTGGTGKDVFTLAGTGAVSVTGGAGNDKFIFGTTFGSTDTVNGGDDTDTLTSDVDNVDAAVITTAFTNVTLVETLGLNGFAAAAADVVNVADIASSLNRVNLDAATAGTSATLTLNFAAGASTVGLNIAAAVAAGDVLTVDAAGTGTADSLAIINMKTATSNIGTTTSNITTTDFETVSINTGTYSTAVDQDLGILSTGTAAVTLSGSNSLILAAGFVGTSLNASGLTGDATLTMGQAATVTSIIGTANADTLFGDTSSSIDGGAGKDTITGGTGNDTLRGGAGDDTIINSGGSKDSVDGGEGDDTVTATLTAGNTIAGGAGNDTLSIAVAATAPTAGGVSGFEKLTFTGTSIAQDMVNFVDNSTFTTINSSLTAGAYTLGLTNVGSSIATLNTTTGTTTTLARLVDTTSNALTVNITGGQTVTAITANNEETINLASTNSTAVSLQTLTAQDLTTLNITGTGSVTITTLDANSSSAGSVLTINGSTNTAGIAVDASNSFLNAIITGSATASNILVGSIGADTILGGALADSISGGLGADNLTGGTGADTFFFDTLTAGAASGTNGVVTGYDVITDFVSTSDVVRLRTVGIATKTGATLDVTTLAAAAATSIVLETAEAVLVTKAVNSGVGIGRVTSANLADTSLVAAMLESAIGTITDGGVVATVQSTYFIVESSDVTGKFAVYAHTQSSTTDITIGGAELNLIGIFTGNAVAAVDFTV